MSQPFWKQLLILMLVMMLFNAYYAYLAQQGAQSIWRRRRTKS